jgi:hypothetical protein
MADPMPQLVRQLNQQVSLLEQDNQRLKRHVMLLHVQLNRCMRIIEALFNRETN